MLAGTMTACLSDSENTNPTVSVTETTSTTTAPTTAEPTTERETENVTESTTKTKTKKKATEKTAEPKETVPTVTEKPKTVTTQQITKSTQPVTQKPTQKATQKTTSKPKTTTKPKATQPTTKKKVIDVNKIVNAGISYGKSLGMQYDSSLTIKNSGWFPPTDMSIYNDTDECITACKEDVQYIVEYYSDKYEPSDIAFNVIAQGGKIYVVYG